jgi:hypothetical protein
MKVTHTHTVKSNLNINPHTHRPTLGQKSTELFCPKNACMSALNRTWLSSLLQSGWQDGTIRVFPWRQDRERGGKVTEPPSWSPESDSGLLPRCRYYRFHFLLFLIHDELSPFIALILYLMKAQGVREGRVLWRWRLDWIHYLGPDSPSLAMGRIAPSPYEHRYWI